MLYKLHLYSKNFLIQYEDNKSKHNGLPPARLSLSWRLTTDRIKYFSEQRKLNKLTYILCNINENEWT